MDTKKGNGGNETTAIKELINAGEHAIYYLENSNFLMGNPDAKRYAKKLKIAILKAEGFLFQKPE